MKCGISIRISTLCLFAGWCLFHPERAHAAEHDLRGQVSAWIVGSSDGGEHFHNGGIRYIPQYTFRQPIDGERFFDLAVMLNGWAAFGSAKNADDADLELYRLAFRFATAQTEARIGLQKINFGPAFLLRALMWFDSLDPRDPLQLTDGVYAARFRYVAMNNASLDLWGLYGNNDLKGIEMLPSDEERPEFGGRLQFPVPSGEIGLTFHNREVDGSPVFLHDFTENRYALDGKWDIEIGLWFEAVFQQQLYQSNFVAAIPGAGGALIDGRGTPYDWTKIMTLGADYTFDIGNGMHVLCEHLFLVFSKEPFGWKEDQQISAYSINYPIGYLDNVSAIGVYSWDTEHYYQYLSWQRTWDDLILKLGLFHYPDPDIPGGVYTRQFVGTGYGGQITVIYNH